MVISMLTTIMTTWTVHILITPCVILYFSHFCTKFSTSGNCRNNSIICTYSSSHVPPETRHLEESKAKEAHKKHKSEQKDM